MIATVYYDGYYAALDGTAREDNPFDRVTEANSWRNWDTGWLDAQDEGRVSNR